MSLHFLAGYVLAEHGKQSARLAAQSGGRSGASSEDVYDLEDRIDRLVLVVAAMWSLLEETGMTADQLQDRIRAMDAADGVSDGKMTPRPTVCRSCGAKVSAGLTACQFCGTDVDAAVAPGPFDTV